MNAVYWGLTALCLMGHKDVLDAEETIEYVMSCWDDEAGTHKYPTTIPIPIPSSSLPLLRAAPPRNSKAKPLNLQAQIGAFGAHPGHDAHILSTLSAIQVLATHDALSRTNVPRVVDCMSLFPLLSRLTD
jgi:geranylgeranyl transferase type-2 subunit beta